MTLAEFYSTIAPLLEGRKPLHEVAETLYGPSWQKHKDAPRLSIYARFCEIHRHQALSVYPHLRKEVVNRLGKPTWDALVAAYFQAHPMRSFELNENAKELPAFLERYGPSVGFPSWFAELADFEWWEWVAQVQKTSDPGTGGPLRLAETTELRRYGVDLIGYLDEQRTTGEPEEEETLVLFFRDRDLHWRRERATPLELLVMHAVTEGIPLSQIALQTGAELDDLEETQADLLDAGILLGG